MRYEPNACRVDGVQDYEQNISWEMYKRKFSRVRMCSLNRVLNSWTNPRADSSLNLLPGTHFRIIPSAPILIARAEKRTRHV